MCDACDEAFTLSAELQHRHAGLRRGRGGGGFVGDGFPRQSWKCRRAISESCLGFLRSSYEKVVLADIWQGVLQFGWEFIPQSGKKAIYHDKLLIWQSREKMEIIYRRFWEMGHIIYVLSQLSGMDFIRHFTSVSVFVL